MAERSYSSGELRTMQEEAARRVSEMRRIADEHLRRSSRREVPKEPPCETPKEPLRPGRYPSPKPPSPSHRSLPVELPKAEPLPAPILQEPSRTLVQKLGLESDQLLLLGLLILLASEEADSTLLLSVFYLLL